MAKVTDFEERAAHAIWDDFRRRCVSGANCPWWRCPSDCACNAIARRHARLALAAVAPVIEAQRQSGLVWKGVAKLAICTGTLVATVLFLVAVR